MTAFQDDFLMDLEIKLISKKIKCMKHDHGSRSWHIMLENQYVVALF